ncbi:MAG: hypothetical protein M3Z30_12480 [Gemmatimonadota bacterium]|nr:hypothetical protein [Gemmatimonadota bacterium]
MQLKESHEVTSSTALTVQRAGYAAAAAQIFACFIPVVSIPAVYTLTWLETGLPGEVILALGLCSAWFVYRARYDRAAWCGAFSAIIAWVVYFELMFQGPRITIDPNTWYGGSPAVGLFISMLAPLVLVALPIVTRRQIAQPQA